ncbi:hypothetical protein QTG54_002302 [Skeletonema marinoi]|uniref:Uncharacterized protein n=1 Tax=Skeletonema marinoi TaxID=267567 RepID=A0AAD8YJ56_9STRA|nr:hypothetical protein QTG54_002302 [Skeletonema marinoi]
MSSGRACYNSQRVLREFHQEAFQYYNQMMERYESFASKESRKRFSLSQISHLFQSNRLASVQFQK